MSKALLAIDAGTGSIRAVIFAKQGQQLSVAQREWEHHTDPRFPGSMDFDAKANWQLTIQCIKEAVSQCGLPTSAIAAISTTSMREGIVLYDKEGTELWACANVDARAGNEVIELAQQTATLEQEIYAESGQTFALGALPRLLWVKKNLPDIYREIASVNMLNDWLIHKLSGKITSEPSNSCTSGIFNLETRKWQSKIAKKCGLRTDIFPPIAESGTIVGSVSAECASQTGLLEGTLVVAGGGDAQLGGVGVGLVSADQAAVFGGSFWQYEYNTIRPKTDPNFRVRVNCHAVPGMWQYEAIAFFPGLIMRWYRDAFCQAEKQEAARLNVDAYTLMEAEATKIPAGCHGMLCTFSDIMNYIAWRHATPTFTNFALDAEKFNRYTFYRAIMENAAMVTKGHIDLVAEVVGTRPAEIIFANGASKSPLWCQILADMTGIAIKVPKIKESTALGAAMCAAVGADWFPSLEEAATAWIQWERTYTPNQETHNLYETLYTQWRKIYTAQLALADRHVTNHLWAAPGF